MYALCFTLFMLSYNIEKSTLYETMIIDSIFVKSLCQLTVLSSTVVSYNVDMGFTLLYSSNPIRGTTVLPNPIECM